MHTLTLIIVTCCSFLFYGVVGEDKAWILAPTMTVAMASVAVFMLRRAWGVSRGDWSLSEAWTPPGTWLWVGFLAWGAAMVPLAVSPFLAGTRLAFLVAVMGAYVLLGARLSAFRDNRIILGGLLLVVALVALYGLVQRFKFPGAILWTERYTDHYGARLAATYMCPNHFAFLMQMLLPFCVALLFIPEAGMFIKILAVYAFGLFMPTLFFTESRAGWLGAIAGVGVVVCLLALRRSKKLFAAVVVLVPLCAALLLVGAWRFSETFQRRMAPVVEFVEGQASGGLGSDARDFRPKTWMDSLAMIRARPWLGYGPGNYRYAYSEFRGRFTGARIVTGHPHNEYLELVADFGLVGFVLFAVAWLWGVGWVLVKSLRAEEARHAFMGFALLGTTAGSMVHSFFDFQLHVFPDAMMFATLAALAVGPLGRGEKRRSARSSGMSTPLQKAAAWALALVFVAGGAYGARVMASDYLRAVGDKAVAEGAHDRGAAHLRRALKVDGANWKALRGLGGLARHERRFTLEPARKARLAEEELVVWENAAARNPKDAEVLEALGRCLTYLGRTQDGPGSQRLQRGLEILREACRVRGFNDYYWWVLGVELRMSGEYEEALEVFQRAERVKRSASSRKNIAWLKRRLAAGDSDDAECRPRVDVEALRTRWRANPTVEVDPALIQLFELMERGAR